MAEGNGLYYMRARYDDARVRRFVSPDPHVSIPPVATSPY